MRAACGLSENELPKTGKSKPTILKSTRFFIAHLKELVVVRAPFTNRIVGQCTSERVTTSTCTLYFPQSTVSVKNLLRSRTLERSAMGSDASATTSSSILPPTARKPSARPCPSAWLPTDGLMLEESGKFKTALVEVKPIVARRSQASIILRPLWFILGETHRRPRCQGSAPRANLEPQTSEDCRTSPCSNSGGHQDEKGQEAFDFGISPVEIGRRERI